MSKEKNYAEINGIGFWVIDTEIKAGFNNSVHEFNQALPFIKNHSKKPVEYTIPAMFLGSDHLHQANTLISAINTNNSITLNHPKLGEISALVNDYQTKTSTKNNQTIITLQLISNANIDIKTTKNHSDIFNDKAQTITQTITSDTKTQIAQLPANQQVGEVKDMLETTSANEFITKIKQSNINIDVINQSKTQLLAIDTLTNSLQIKLKHTDELVALSKNMQQFLSNKDISGSQLANQFYDLQYEFAEVVLQNNQHLPKIKSKTYNAKLPAQLIQHEKGEVISRAIHPLFNNEIVEYVS